VRGDIVRVTRDSREVKAGTVLELDAPSRRYAGAWQAWQHGTGGKWMVLVDEEAFVRAEVK